ncbi:MAG TPA: FAD-binding oxidoreductase [Casimicrobiaceae bacterium]|nr:FAD-binding oxidoreductase [Casimicrobiaceae bacterium]
MSDTRATRSSVVIIGAGLVGCATAYYLAQRGLSVRVLERGRVGAEQSSRAWGLLRQQGREPAELPLAMEALRMWPALPQELGADMQLTRNGILMLAESADDEGRLIDAEANAKVHGIECRLLTPREIASLIPELVTGWRIGLYTPQDGHVEPIEATRAFAAAARGLGVDIRENTPVLGIETTAGVASGALTAERVFAGDAILCVAGIGSADVTRSLGTSLPIQVVRATVAQTLPASPITPIPVWAPHAAFRPRADGSFCVGNGYRGIDAEHDLTLDSFRHVRAFFPTLIANRHLMRLRIGTPFLEDLRRRGPDRAQPLSEPEPNHHLVTENAHGFARLLPQFKGLGIAKSWAGRIDATPDLIPMIGELPSIRRYYIAAGFNGHGLALAPAVGRALAELVVDGRAAVDLRGLRVERYAEGDFKRTGNKL